MTKNRLIALLVTINVLVIALVVLRETGLAQRSPLFSEAFAAQVTGPLSTAESRKTPLVQAAQTMSPSVVSVGASRSKYYISPHASFFRDFTVFEQEEEVPYLGSGVIIDTDGLIVTNYHVVEDAKDVFVTLTDGRKLDGKVLDADVALDIALIKVEAKNLPAAKMGNNEDLMVGEWVLAMGNPFGNVIGDPTPSVTAGVVSALNRDFKPSGDIPKVFLDMIQTDAAINPGNSGGALVNSAGELIGINTFIMSRSGGAEGVGFAIPVNRVKSVVNEITTHGKIRSRLVDFQTRTLNKEMAEILKSTATNGAVVTKVNPGGPAAKAGLKVGDVITQVNGDKIQDAQDLRIKVWYNQPVGSNFRMDVDRAGSAVSVDYTVVEPD